MGVQPIAAHFFVLWIAHAALITPPVCVAAYLAGAIARAPLMATGWQACRLGVVVYIMSLIWVQDPALLLIGSPGHIIAAVVTAIAGVYFVSCGVAGQMFKPASWPERILLMAGGVLLMIPGRYVDPTGFWYTDLAGLAAVALPVLWQVAGARFMPARLLRRGRAGQSGDSGSSGCQ